MIKHRFLASLLVVLLGVAAVAPWSHADDKEIETAMRALKRARKMAESHIKGERSEKAHAKLLSAQEALIRSRASMPAQVAALEGSAKTEARTAYIKLLVQAHQKLLEAELLTAEGKYSEARAALEALEGLEKTGHSKFRVK